MRWAVVAVLLSACGRIGFDGLAGGDGGGSGDSAGPDVPFNPVCGDGVCTNSVGERCSTCSDCATRNPVCGNGHCDPGEDGACIDDCGPTPWPWSTEELDLVARVNAARTGGTTCPGGGGQMTAPSLSRDASLDGFAREWAWELTDGDLAGLGLDSCNGRTGADRLADVNVIAGYSLWINVGDPTAMAFFDGLVVQMDPCLAIVSTSHTRVGIGAAQPGGERAWVILFE